MKPVDVKPDSYAKYNVDSNEKDPRFQVGDHVRIWKYKNIFAKGYTPNCSQDFVISKIKNIVSWTYVIICYNDLNGEDIADTFYVKELRKTNQKEFRIERWLKEKETNYMSNGKIMIIHLIAGLIKTILYKNELILFQTIWTFWRRY